MKSFGTWRPSFEACSIQVLLTPWPAYTSMRDLIVVDLPIPEPAYGVVVVRAPGSLQPPRDGHVLIEEMSVTGHNDKIERPVAEAIPLF